MYSNILFEQKDGIAVITLNRPRVLNALSRALKAEVSDALARIAADRGVRAVVLIGAGKAFSAGQDLNEAKDLDGPGAEEWVREFERLYEQVRAVSVPIIAAVNGWAMGAGCQLALLADIRISSTTAKYGMPEIRDGIPAIFGLGLLWNLVGMSRSLYLVLSGDTLNAREAWQAGLTAKVVSPARLRREALALAGKLARFAPLALKLDKEWARRLTEEHFRATARFCVEAQHEAFAAGDAKRFMEEFLSKRRTAASSRAGARRAPAGVREG
ncbi:MAG TPA: enoyl-CoA hydratase/isomerase family protein [Candidatus Methylomirabilis sp.]|nr:enoyl-CoA hydratase/isomerase family protein [Candidatus Methylomirabilis sp.]